MDYWNFVEYLCTRNTLHTRTVLEQIKLGKQLPTLAQNKGLVRNEQGGGGGEVETEGGAQLFETQKREGT